jgi:HD superfamily phosphohydrolase
LLDAPALQRLRRLRQLGLAYLAFPSAEHSRFTHALGALAMGSRAFDELVRNGRAFFGDDADVAYQRRLVRAALLLHDIGHGPFSHACEAVLGVRHEARTSELLDLAGLRHGLEALDVAPAEVLGLVLGDPQSRYPALRELVSGPNLDADRMDYLQRDAYFTGVATGRYDAEQLVASLRLFERNGRVVLGIDARGVVALESFVMARYMMFASVYFHHTTRIFERVLQDVLRELWPNPRLLDAIDEFLRWDDFRVLDSIATTSSEAARALRERIVPYALAAEFNAERDLSVFEACETALRERFGPQNVWADEQSQVLHRLPLGIGEERTVWVATPAGPVDAREASDLIAKLSGKAFWRKLFVRRDAVDVAQARRLCAEIVAGNRANSSARRHFSRASSWARTFVEIGGNDAAVVTNFGAYTDTVLHPGLNGVNITFVSVTDIVPSKEYQDASERRAIAQQELQRAQIELQTKGVQGQQNYFTAQYQAKANRELINSFGGDPRLADAIVRLKTIELSRGKWTSGNLPAVMGGGSTLLDLSGANGAPNKTP